MEATEAGKMLEKEGFKFDICFTSVLKRAVVTWNLVAEQIDHHHIPVIKHWRLNDSHYGNLQGLKKSETAAKHGEDQVLIWRRSYDIPPPELDMKDKRYPGNDVKYGNIPQACLPATESLKLTVDRVLPFWFDQICPAILEGKNVVVSAHGNSLRAIVKYVDNMTAEQVIKFNIPTAVPLIYEFDHNLKPIKHYYLASEEEVAAKIAKVANQGKAKK